MRTVPIFVLFCISSQRAYSQPGKEIPPIIWTGKVEGWVEVHGEPGVTPHKPISDSWKMNSTSLWIGIASYRDPLCGATIHRLFHKAAHPERFQVYVIQQNQPDDEGCVESYCKLVDPGSPDHSQCQFSDRIHVHKMLAKDAKGPVHARAIQSRRIDDSEFCMQIDAHMDFAINWDLSLFQFWGQTQNEYAVLSTYCAPDDQIGKNVHGHYEVPHLCMINFSKKGHIRNEQAKAARELVEPKLTTLWAAGLSFSKCHAERRVPNDPHLPHLFDGEEFSRAVRFWTHGYDFYTPPRTVVVHFYNRKILGTWPHDEAQMKSSTERVFRMLEMEGSDYKTNNESYGIYGLGQKRTLDQYIAFSGFDVRRRKIAHNKCGHVEWVPFTEDESLRNQRLDFFAKMHGGLRSQRRLKKTAREATLSDLVAMTNEASIWLQTLWIITGIWGILVLAISIVLWIYGSLDMDILKMKRSTRHIFVDPVKDV